MNRHFAILLIGPPGSGKGTQAQEIVTHFPEHHHLDAGHIIETAVHDPKNQDDPHIRLEREKFEGGLLTSTEWVLGLMKEHIERVARSGNGVVLSGQPRTREEADILVPYLLDIYGQGSIIVFHLIVSRETSLFRNSHRRVCKQCAASLLWSPDNEKLVFCPKCGGDLRVRALDKPEIIEKRLIEYEHFTKNTLPYFDSLGIPVFDIEGEQEPGRVAEDIETVLKDNFI